MSTTTQLPHWDVSSIYPSLQSDEFNAEYQALLDGIGDLERSMERFHVAVRPDPAVDDETIRAFEAIIADEEALAQRLHTLHAYIRSFVSTDSYDTLAQGKLSELQQHTVRLTQLSNRLVAWLGSLDVDALIDRSAKAADLAYFLRKVRVEAQHMMSLAEEDLASELALSGGSAWSKLYGNISSQLMVPIEIEDERQSMPMSLVRNMAHDPDRDVRRRAYQAELDAWRTVTTPLAAALNGIKGESNTVLARRGWDSALDLALFNTNIDRQTLDAMLGAARASFPDFRRYLRAKARALGVPALAWYDLFAPVSGSEREWDYEEGCAFLLDQFGAYSDRLRSFAERAIRERWIDAEPRPGKVGGAFCMWIRGDESRVLSNYLPSYDGVSTLAHELGHAYHNFNLAERSIMQRQTPMTLAETASIFCETIIEHAALSRADRHEQLAILEASIQGACQVVVDITSRFMFEQTVFERRLQRELAVDELNEIMLAVQRETYGDGLDQSQLHPLMWAAKTHYYSTGRPFYNFPYMFGLLFGLGLYAIYQREPDGFPARYDHLLSSTGLADAATLAEGFGIDIRTPEFWTASLDVVRRNIDRFESLVDAG
jgi:oligoendopeptidase F